MSLTNVEIQNADATDKPIRLFDGRGLYLEVSPRGSRCWRLKYRFQGREKRLALGVYPEVSLKEARARCDEARKQIADGQDPAFMRRLERERLNGPTFETIAREWHEKRQHLWKPDYAELVLHWLVINAFPWLGDRRLADASPRELLLVLRRIDRCSSARIHLAAHPAHGAGSRNRAAARAMQRSRVSSVSVSMTCAAHSQAGERVLAGRSNAVESTRDRR